MRLVQGAAPGASLAENWEYMRDNFRPATVSEIDAYNDAHAVMPPASRPLVVSDEPVSGKVSQLSPAMKFFADQMRVVLPPADDGSRPAVERDTREQEMLMRRTTSKPLSLDQMRLKSEQRKADFDRLEQFEPKVDWEHPRHKAWVLDRLRAMAVWSAADEMYRRAQRQ